jgi:hypothetical protein
VEGGEKALSPVGGDALVAESAVKVAVVDGVEGLADVEEGGEEGAVGGAVVVGDEVKKEGVFVAAAVGEEASLFDAERDRAAVRRQKLANLEVEGLEEESGERGEHRDGSVTGGVGGGSRVLGEENGAAKFELRGHGGVGWREEWGEVGKEGRCGGLQEADVEAIRSGGRVVGGAKKLGDDGGVVRVGRK